TEPKKSDDDICSSKEFDAATTVNEVTYLFRGEYYFTIDSNGIVERKGRKISNDFNGLPNNLNAAVTTREGITYFFKGDQFYQARGRRVESGPRPISSEFKNVPNNLDAAFLYTKDGLIYFIKNNRFIRYDFEGEELSVDDRFSSGFNFQPVGVRAAFNSKSNNFFFFDWYYYRVGMHGVVQEQARDIFEMLKCNN
ncbi:matrix metalloproteinase-16-like protein, partial [Dinothrombium tinctorium]